VPRIGRWIGRGRGGGESEREEREEREESSRCSDRVGFDPDATEAVGEGVGEASVAPQSKVGDC
jgi:hypothetical protein